MYKFQFKFSDLMRAPRIALSFQRIWIQFIGFTLGYLFYGIFTYLALWLQGMPLVEVWRNYYLIPYLTEFTVDWYVWLVFGIGVVGFLFSLVLAGTAGARATYMTLRGEPFYTWRQAYHFAFKKKNAIIVAPLALLVISLIIVAGGWFLGLLGRIPWIGPLGFSLLLPVWIGVCAILGFIILITCLTGLLSPAILATTDEDAFEVIFQTIPIVWQLPWRLAGYQIWSAVQALLGLSVLAFFVKKAVLLMLAIYQVPYLVATGFRNDFQNMMSQAFAILEKWLLNLTLFIDQLLGAGASVYKSLTYFATYHPFMSRNILSSEIALAADIVAFGLLFIGGLVLAYGLATFQAGNTISYLLLRLKREGDDLLQRPDRELEAAAPASEITTSQPDSVATTAPVTNQS